jgi:hypothetical protein
MMKRSSHSPGTSVVDLWARKKRRGLPTWNQGKRWLGRAQTKPGLARYRTKAFAEEQDAWQWAENTVAKYRLGLDNGNRCTINAVQDDYLEHAVKHNEEAPCIPLLSTAQAALRPILSCRNSGWPAMRPGMPSRLYQGQ